MDSMKEKKKKKRRRNKLDVEYKEDYSANIVRGWMLGKPVVGEAVFDDRNEDVFEPRPSRLGLGATYVSHAEASMVRTKDLETKAQNALMKRLKKEERKRTEAMKLNQEILESDASDSDIEESRTSHVRSKAVMKTPILKEDRKRKRKKKKKK